MPVLILCNWASPSLVRDQHLAEQVATLHAILNNDAFDAMAIIVTPIWERAKGNLYKAEREGCQHG